MKNLRDILFSLAIAGFSLSMPACTDAATRLAYDIRSGALELESSDLEKLEIEHKPASWPEGVKGDYNVIILTTDPASKPNMSLVVGRYWTTYHTNFVKVPKTLQIAKKKGESVFLLLIKTNKSWLSQGDETYKVVKTIEIVSVR